MVSKELENIISPAFNEKLLENILKKSSGCKNVCIKKVILRDTATNKGDSYLSSIVRFSIEGTTTEKEDEIISCHVIVKMLPKNVARRKSFRSHDFFKNEASFYNDVWDALLKFQETKNLKNPFLNVPVCYAAAADGEYDYIALEDLNSQNFSTFRRQGEMDYDTVILIIHLFARFHALSFAFKDQNPEEFDRISNCLEESYFCDKFRKWYAEFHSMLIAVTRDAVQKELPSMYLQKFDEMISKDLYGQICAIAGNTKARFSVFTQGDAWVPNFLCKYDTNNQPTEMKLIDFQLARCTSPVSDIAFFLYACTSYELLLEHWDHIIEEYHKAFCKFLTELGSSPDIFPIKDFKEDLKKNFLYGVGMAMEALPFLMMEDNETADLDAMQGEEALPITTVWKVTPIKTSAGRQRLANVIKHAVDNEFF